VLRVLKRDVDYLKDLSFTLPNNVTIEDNLTAHPSKRLKFLVKTETHGNSFTVSFLMQTNPPDELFPETESTKSWRYRFENLFDEKDTKSYQVGPLTYAAVLLSVEKLINKLASSIYICSETDGQQHPSFLFVSKEHKQIVKFLAVALWHVSSVSHTSENSHENLVLKITKKEDEGRYREIDVTDLDGDDYEAVYNVDRAKLLSLLSYDDGKQILNPEFDTMHKMYHKFVFGRRVSSNLGAIALSKYTSVVSNAIIKKEHDVLTTATTHYEE